MRRYTINTYSCVILEKNVSRVGETFESKMRKRDAMC